MSTEFRRAVHNALIFYFELRPDDAWFLIKDNAKALDVMERCGANPVAVATELLPRMRRTA